MLGLHAQDCAEHTSEVSPIEGQERWEVFYSPNLISWQFLGCIMFLKYPRLSKTSMASESAQAGGHRRSQRHSSGMFRILGEDVAGHPSICQSCSHWRPQEQKVSEKKKEIILVNFKSKYVHVERSIFQNAVGEMASIPSMTGQQERQWKPAVLIHCATLSYAV